MNEPSPELRHFSGHVAHDLNNLLSALLGYGELLRNGLPEGHPLREFADNLLEATRHGGALARNLGALGGRVATRPQPISTTTLASEVAVMLNAADQQIVRVVPGVEGTVQSDPKVLGWALAGAVAQLQPLLADDVILPLEPRRDGLVLHLGRHFAAAEIEALFACYHPVNPACKGGLDCAVLATVLRQAGGGVELEDTRLVLRLPMQRTASGPRSWRGRTVLVVSADDSRRTMAETALCAVGATVFAAVNVDEAVGLAQAFGGTIDVLFSEPDTLPLPGLALACQDLPADAAAVVGRR
jgi:hypothetical protein